MVTTASGKTDMRSFTVVEAKRVDGCPTKFAVKGHGGRFIKRTPRAAASTAFNRLCRRKRIKGQCAMILSVQETTQGSAGKYSPINSIVTSLQSLSSVVNILSSMIPKLHPPRTPAYLLPAPVANRRARDQ